MDNVIFFVLMVIACFALVVATCIYTKKKGYDGTEKGNELEAGAFGVAVITLGILFLSPLFYEYPGPDAVVVSVVKDGSTATVHSFGTFEFDGEKAFNVPKVMRAKSSVTPITSNPKARHISYSVWLAMANPEIYFTKSPERWNKRESIEVRGEVTRTAQYWLYEFNDKHSQELAELYNPLDPGQVSKLRQMLLPWLNEKLAADGLRATNVSFDVN